MAMDTGIAVEKLDTEYPGKIMLDIDATRPDAMLMFEAVPKYVCVPAFVDRPHLPRT
jgi:hypothetical protein